jgi:hypothetical protein
MIPDRKSRLMMMMRVVVWFVVRQSLPGRQRDGWSWQG